MLALTSALGGIIALLGRKATTVAATLGTFVLLLTAFIACINTIFATVISLMIVPAWVSNSIGMFIPGDFTAVLSAIMSSRLCRAGYDLAMEKVRAINSAT